MTDEYDRLRRRVLWSMPSGLYVVGSHHDGRYNLMTLNLATQVSLDPKQIAIAVLDTAFTHELIAANKTFTLNLIDRQDRAMVRKFVKPVSHDADAETLNGFEFSEAKTGSPVLSQAVGYLDCEVRQTVPVGDHSLFIGEVVDAGFNGDESRDVLRMEDTKMNYGG